MEIYGSNSKAIAALMPQAMDRLSLVIPAGLGYDYERLVREHSAINYYAAFMDASERKRMESTFLVGDSNGRPIGVMATPVRPSQKLRFCVDCKREQLRQRGEAFWKLSHQLPIVTMCVDHGEILRESHSPSQGAKNMLVLPDDENCPDNADTVLREAKGADLRDLKTLAIAAMKLLAGHYPSGLHNTWPAADLLSELAGKGYMSADNRVRWEALNADVKKVLTGVMPAFPDILEKGEIGSWFLSLRFGATSQPTDRVLIAKFAIEMLVGRDIGFGTGPWQCFNPLGDHDGQHVVTKVRKLRVFDGRLQGRFSCGCGYEYTRSIDDQGRWGKPAIWEFGPNLDRHVKTAIQNGWSLNKPPTRWLASARKLFYATPRDGVYLIRGVSQNRPADRGQIGASKRKQPMNEPFVF